jgi:hypothetical protein
VYLFVRSVRVSGNKLQDAVQWATRITERVRQAAGLDVALWSSAFSPRTGTLAWGTLVPDLATLETALSKLDVDEGLNNLIASDQYTITGSLDDALARVVHGTPDGERRFEYVAVVSTTMVVGKLARGIPLGVEIAEKAESITGAPTMFLSDMTGNYGGVSWHTGYADIAEAERSSQRLSADQSFTELIDGQCPGVYTEQPGATRQNLFRRIA